MSIDTRLSRLARRHRPDGAARAVARLGSPSFVAAEGIAAAVALGEKGRPNLRVALAAPAAIALVTILKHLVRRPRPVTRLRRKGRQSFPSSHAAALAALATCAWQVAPRTFNWRLILAVGSALTAGIGVERLSAGEHWPSDVAVGATLGATIGALLGRARQAP